MIGLALALWALGVVVVVALGYVHAHGGPRTPTPRPTLRVVRDDPRAPVSHRTLTSINQRHPHGG